MNSPNETDAAAKGRAAGAGGAGIAIEKHWVNAFATPIVTYPWPESEALNADLRALILEREAASDGGMVRSNLGGWHSGLDLFSWESPAVKTLHERVRNLVIATTRAALTRGPSRRFRATYHMLAWANVLRNGHYHNVHNHPENTWSGVYYVDDGAPEADRPFNGVLELLDPRIGANMINLANGPFELRYTIRPTPGLMVVFPSWLKHFVHPFFGTGTRISVAFNVRVADLQFMDAETGGAAQGERADDKPSE